MNVASHTQRYYMGSNPTNASLNKIIKKQRSPAQEKPKESLQTTPTTESVNTNASTCGSTSLNCGEESDVVTAMFVPVILSLKEQPDTEIRVYALLDDCSDSTFVKDSVLKELGVSGTDVSLKLNTMHGQTSISVQRVEGLVVQRLNRSEDPIHLPKTYSRESIPSGREQIPTPEVAAKWAHLENIKDQITPLEGAMKIGLLIGCN